MLSLYDINEEDIDGVIDHSQLSTITQPSPLQMQLPILELLKVCVYNVLLFICATHSISNPAYACAVVCIVFFFLRLLVCLLIFLLLAGAYCFQGCFIL